MPFQTNLLQIKNYKKKKTLQNMKLNCVCLMSENKPICFWCVKQAHFEHFKFFDVLHVCALINVDMYKKS